MNAVVCGFESIRLTLHSHEDLEMSNSNLHRLRFTHKIRTELKMHK